MPFRRHKFGGMISEAIQVLQKPPLSDVSISEMLRPVEGPDFDVDGVDQAAPGFPQDAPTGAESIHAAIQAEQSRQERDLLVDEATQVQFRKAGPGQYAFAALANWRARKDFDEYWEEFGERVAGLVKDKPGAKTGAFTARELAGNFAIWDRKGLRKRGKITTAPKGSRR